MCVLLPQKKDVINSHKLAPTTICRYECLQNDVLEYQSRGVQILVGGDLDAGTAEELDILKAQLRPFLPTAPHDELPTICLDTEIL